METHPDVAVVGGYSSGTDPTYKEWKLRIALNILHLLLPAHGSYLQGMETHT